MAHLWEFVLHYDFNVLSYTPEGDCRLGLGVETPLSAPIRLKWDFCEDLNQIIGKAFISGKNENKIQKNINFNLFFSPKCPQRRGFTSFPSLRLR